MSEAPKWPYGYIEMRDTLLAILSPGELENVASGILLGNKAARPEARDTDHAAFARALREGPGALRIVHETGRDCAWSTDDFRIIAEDLLDYKRTLR
jgi:hypothetical protein